ncbi:SIS domain-containing protein [Paenibacillus lutrae]|uniref:SIS domain-containing protein n=1 Tax=Paenibacillus lutrae TaxID=2078573 RepID=A0A7X3FFG6_9BACL|nr:SIS domain-containing protein [Paenibacillus lutrae]MVO98563.1 SIS domain-containing protein [Paenibacillus lutrae]
MSNENVPITYKEISAQAEAIKAAWEQLQKQSDWVNRYIGNEKYDEVVFIGSGSSYYQSITMAATFRKWTGRSASAQPSSDIFLIRDATLARDKRILIVGVSRSGESHEVILALESVKGLPHIDTCGITTHETSTMFGMTECLLSPLGKEKSTVMSKSLSSMTFMMQAAIAMASGQDAYLQELQTVLELDEELVKASDTIIKEWVAAHDCNKTVYLGLGALGGLALEACLKLKEMTYTWTEAYGTLEFRHGPKSIVDSGTLVCLLLSESTREYELQVAREMKDYGAQVLLITAKRGDDTDFADLVIEVGGAKVSDEARSVLYLPAVQYNGYYSAMKLGLNPDDPRNLTQFVQI